jgi:hypothetical protein
VALEPLETSSALPFLLVSYITEKMIRTVYRGPGALNVVTRRLLSSPHANPSTSTSVILTKLPPSTVDSELKNSLKSLDKANCRRVMLQPGCSLHFANKYEANVAASVIESKMGLEVNFASLEYYYRCFSR